MSLKVAWVKAVEVKEKEKNKKDSFRRQIRESQAFKRSWSCWARHFNHLKIKKI